MNLAFNTLFLFWWLAIIVSLVLGCMLKRRRRLCFGLVGGLTATLGIVSFVGAAGGGRLPSGIEWPMGYAADVFTLPSGEHVAAHDPSNRVQIYDAQWRFLRGWGINAAGGSIYTTILPDNTIEVLTARTHLRLVYAIDGRLISRSPAPPRAPQYGTKSVSPGQYVPTKPWMWTLTHPFIAWALIPLGFGFGALARSQRKH